MQRKLIVFFAVAYVVLGVITPVLIFGLPDHMKTHPQSHNPIAEAIHLYQQDPTVFVIPEYPDTSREEREKWSLLRDVMACESGSRWVITEVPGVGYDTGPAQINTKHHYVRAARMGLDLFKPSENVLYTIYLFEEYYPAMKRGSGFNPWLATKECWQERQLIRKEQAKL